MTVRLPRIKVRPGRLLVTAWVALFLPVGSAAAATYLPPAGKVFAGAAGQPVSSYEAAVGKHPAVYEDFVAWGEYLPAIFADPVKDRARLVMSITTASGSREVVTPGGIARGDGDSWLVAINRAAFASGGVVYVRLMPEMDGNWNPYSAFNADGSRRDSDHSTAAFRRAWKRATLILRGGPLASINATLARLGMPAVRGVGSGGSGSSGAALPRPKLAMLWVPQVAGAPDVSGNQPRAYWPGSRWVDWVGTDFYSNAPNFSGLDSFYGAFRGKPFLFGEYALWGADDPGWVNRLFGWVGSHRRTRMLIYNQGLASNGPLRLSRYPRGAAALRRRLASRRFPAYAPGLKP